VDDISQYSTDGTIEERTGLTAIEINEYLNEIDPDPDEDGPALERYRRLEPKNPYLIKAGKTSTIGVL
jgi:hypothetical protein